MTRRTLTVVRIATVVLVDAGITALYATVLQVNPTTVALSYLVAILLLATSWGLLEATVASVVAVLCFNFFFLPPVGTLTIADPQNWVAFVAFLVTAVVASQLSGRARQREIDAAARQRDLERLYALSRALLLSPRAADMPGAIARHIAEIFELPTVGVYDRRTDLAATAGSREMSAIDTMLRDVARRSAAAHDGRGLIAVAIQLGGAPIGSVALTDVGVSDTVLQSIANLAAIGLERARADEAAARAEAARESSELRATVLDAMAHEFKTPLTAMKAASSDLLAHATSSRDRELETIIDEELEHLNALVSDAVQMLRIDAGHFAVHLERHAVADIAEATVKRFDQRLDGHAVTLRIPPGLMVNADRELIALALRQLVDNAVKYSTSGAAIDITAASNGSVDVAVHNSGSVIPGAEQPRVFERFFRGAAARQIPGTGMGLAIVRQIAEAHGGTLRVDSSPDHGTTFTLSLPREEPAR
jgi:two-component system sensor histidine kinase KdpD